ncbi:hypothetical protein OIV83_006173 [Microbotryomycetes sp. JL201]|nr:hypothetical protein OIV83_006173 [Microbotryomycetes sp. JL201]
MAAYYIGVDVGSGSARAALVSDKGDIVAESVHETLTRRDDSDSNIFEQSTEQIWDCIAQACRNCLQKANVDKSQVKGIGFDATCSLAVANIDTGEPVSVSPDSWHTDNKVDGRTWDVILWADHRAFDEAKLINSTGSMVLKYVGGTMSLEMEAPKMLWLKRHMPKDVFERSMFFDLPDFLTYRATGDLARSNCSLACKCSYVPPGVEGSKGWNDEFFTKIGLEEFPKTDYKQVGGQPGKSGLILTAGQPVGTGLSAKAAEELGLLEGTPVGSGVIDAYAGWIGTVAAPMEGQSTTSLDDSKHRLAAIAGTSTYWMNEGGQSSTGQLLDFMIDTHPASARLKQMAKEKGTNHFSLLAEILTNMAKERKVPFMSYLTKDMTLYPDLHGNRSPLADNDMRGMLIGMKLDKNVSDLALRYYATGEAIALQTRQIIDEMNKNGHQVKSIFMSGGLIADVCNVPVQLPYSHSASVVLGSAMLGAAAAQEAANAPVLSTQELAEKGSFGMKERLWDIMVKMSKPGTTVKPSASEKELQLLKVKYNTFLECIELQRKWRRQVSEALGEAQ